MRNKSREMPQSLILHLTLLSTAREDTDPKNNRYAGTAKRLVTFVVLSEEQTC